jgi:protein TonB
VAARLLERPAPRYPAAARRSGQAGTVHLRLEVRTDGRVGRVEVAATSGFLLLDEAAVASARSWRFSPAKENGRLVAEWRRVAVEFRLEDAAGQG